MAIGRGSMTKELVGNRVKKMAFGGMAGAAGAADVMGRDRGQSISTMARQRPPIAAAPTVGNVPPTPMNAVGGKPTVMPMKPTAMKKGGKVKAGMRGCGCATRGTKGGKMV